MYKKFNSTLTYAFIGVLIIASIIGFGFLNGGGEVEDVADSTAGLLTIMESVWDIGDVSMVDGKDTKDIEVKNSSNFPVKIIDMQTSCMCTTVQVVRANGKKSAQKGMAGHGSTTRLSETILPGENVIFRVVFDPNAHGPDATGMINRSVMIKTDSKVQSEIKLSFSGNVIK